MPRSVQIAGAVVGLFVLACILQLRSAQDDLRAAEVAFDEARLAVSETRNDDADAALDRARAALDDARDAARSFPVGLTRAVPVVGSPAAAVVDVTDAGAELVEAGRIVTASAAAFPTSGAFGIDGHDLSGFHAAATDGREALEAAEVHVRRADAILAGPAGAALPPVSSAARGLRATVADVVDQFDGAERGLALLEDLSGPTTQATILVLSQDTYELRPTGGFVGSYGVLEFDRGTVELTEYDDVHELPEPDPPMEPPPFLGGHLPALWELENALWWPDFPRSAENAVEMFRRQRGVEVDGVIAMTEDVVARLVGAVGPVEVPGYAPVVEEGFADRVIYETTIKRPRDEPRKKFTIELSKVVLDEIFSLDGDELVSVTDALRRNAPGDLQLWFPDAGRQELVAGTSFAGAMPPPERDFLMVVDANLTASKANRGLTRDIVYRPTWDADEKRYLGQLRMTFTNADAEWEHNPYYNGFVRVYAPAGAELLPGEDNARFASLGQEDGFEVFGGWVFVPPEERLELLVEYWLPDTVEEGRTYGLTWRRQPGTTRDSLSVVAGGRSVAYPTEAEALDVEHDVRSSRVREFLHDRWLPRQLGF